MTLKETVSTFLTRVMNALYSSVRVLPNGQHLPLRTSSMVHTV
jgi:hypothetical protein